MKLTHIPETVATDMNVEDGKLTVHRTEDVEPILDHAKALSNAGYHSTGMGDKHAASIPKVIVETYCNTKGISFHDFCANPEHIKAMLNDPALSGFRVWRGHV